MPNFSIYLHTAHSPYFLEGQGNLISSVLSGYFFSESVDFLWFVYSNVYNLECTISSLTLSVLNNTCLTDMSYVGLPGKHVCTLSYLFRTQTHIPVLACHFPHFRVLLVFCFFFQNKSILEIAAKTSTAIRHVGMTVNDFQPVQGID